MSILAIIQFLVETSQYRMLSTIRFMDGQNDYGKTE